jgi:lipoprotein-anchoring transpeptidase ErfK/SrfK
MKHFILLLAAAFSLNAFAQLNSTPTAVDAEMLEEPTFLDEFDPNAPNAEELLNEYDKYYEELTGQNPWVYDERLYTPADGCYRDSCSVWAYISKAQQRLYLYRDGRHVATWKVSTGTGNRTPDFDRHPNGRIYDAYSSNAYPGGDYKGLGNMPYAVFIQGGFAIHGTQKVNWPKLGSKASHGCIRLHPDHGYTFNRLVRAYGVADTWITVD